jgi:hypothetical protein
MLISFTDWRLIPNFYGSVSFKIFIGFFFETINENVPGKLSFASGKNGNG